MLELVTKVVTDDSFTGRFVNLELSRCWEVNECTKTDCPAHDNFGNLRCWEVADTFCKGKTQGTFAQKYGDCSLCEVYRGAMINPIYKLGETFNTMAAILSDRREALIQSRAETERLNYELQEALLHSNEYAVSLEVTKGEIEKHAIELNHQATHDALTGLPNRKYFEQHLSELVIGAEGRESHSFVVLFLDLDKFKTINDTLGHKAGDLLLVEVAARLQACLRSEDTLARMGGDEITVILPHSQHRSVAQSVASRMIESISRPFDIQDHEVLLGASIGIASYPSDGTDAVALLKNADAAMYKAKLAGRGTYRWYSDEVTILNQ
ncbi:MAG: diguanylate cyclase domain-containing protein [Armatimonadota bacterium]